MNNAVTKGEREFALSQAAEIVAGVDEVGRGCLAGPVYAAAVVLNYDRFHKLDEKQRLLIRDSKTLSKTQRQKAAEIIQSIVHSHGIGVAEVEEIDQVGILNATFVAMRRALHQLIPGPDWVLVDGHLKIREYQGQQEAIIDGDKHSFAIAAASILAKQARDSFMTELAQRYPQYGFENHVGYGTKSHLEQLKAFGACIQHRRSFAPIRHMSLPPRSPHS